MGKYYAMFGDEKRGPYTLEELVEAGVRPDTYVWCKGMADWEKADEVADICRYYRQRIVELQHPRRPEPAETPQQEETSADTEIRWVRGIPEQEYDPAEHDPGEPPPTGMMAIAILTAVICFPLTGAVAIYYAVKARKAWTEAQRGSSKTAGKLYTQEEREEIRNELSDSVRQCKMWTGITVFMGVMMYAAMIHLL